MNRKLLGISVFAGLFLFPGCGQLLSLENACRITNVAADARRDERGNQVDVFEFDFAEGSCSGTHVNASYNLGTQEAQEKLERADATATASWRCPSDPWINLGSVRCTRIDLRVNGSVEYSQTELEQYERTHGAPLSVYPMVSIDQETLKGQLGNALKRLPSASLADSVFIDQGTLRVGRPPNISVLTGGDPVPEPAPAAPPAPAPSLGTGQPVRKGADGPNVEAIQLLLRQSGNDDIVVDGDFGDQTDAAVRAFQRTKRLKDDGIVGPDTWRALWVTVRKSAPQEDAVSAAQTLLNWHKAEIEVDGDFGDQTEAAVRAFQRAKQLSVDGVVGPNTWTALVNSP